MRKCINFYNAVCSPVYLHVKTSTQDVLVKRRPKPWLNFGCRRMVGARKVRNRQHNARELCFKLDRPVLVEVPEVAVLVIIDSHDGRHHKPATAAHLNMSVYVNVFPQNTHVFFVHTDCIGDIANRTVWLSNCGIQIHNLA